MRAKTESAVLGTLLCLAIPTAAQQSVWGQCGGTGWTGPTTCEAGSTCVYQNEWYSQCLPSSESSQTTSSSPSTTSADLSASASSSCATAVADGFASLNGGTTGGNGGSVVVVQTQSELEQYAGASGRYVIKVVGTIAISPTGTEVSVASDKTIVGVGSDAEISGGGFRMIEVQNVVVRNLKIGNTLNDEDNDWDAIQIDTGSNIWIDHCHLEAGGDGLLDSRKDTTYLTVSWTVFRRHDKTFGIGWTDKVTAQTTIHHNWFDDVNQRNPSADNIRHAHLYNNYLSDVTSYGHYARGATEMRMENCYFSNVKNPVTRDDDAKLQATGNTYAGCTGTTASNTGSVFDPASFYQYDLDATEDVPSVVSAGAGRQSSICPA